MRFETSGQAYIFDCDGVLLNTNNSKVEAVCEVLRDIGMPEHIIDICKTDFSQNFGRTRLEHFERFFAVASFEGWFPKSSESFACAIKAYGAKVELIYESTPLLPEAESFISRLSAAAGIYVVSASDELQLKRVLPKKSFVFKRESIFGGPKTKTENLSSLIGENVRAFYGDSVKDLEAAMEVGMPFVGLTDYSLDANGLRSSCEQHGFVCVGGFYDL